MAAPITTGFAGGLAVYNAALQLRVGIYRKSNGVRYGTADKTRAAEDLELTSIRAAGVNFNEYTPTGMMLLYLLETQTKTPKKVLLGFAIAFAAVRLVHSLALYTGYMPSWDKFHEAARPPAFVSTILLIAGAGGYLAYWALKSAK